MDSLQSNGKITRKAFLVGATGAALGPYLLRGAGAATAAGEPATSTDRTAPPIDYPLVRGGTWVRGPNLKDRQGRFQARQEHAAAPERFRLPHRRFRPVAA